MKKEQDTPTVDFIKSLRRGGLAALISLDIYTAVSAMAARGQATSRASGNFIGKRFGSRLEWRVRHHDAIPTAVLGLIKRDIGSL